MDPANREAYMKDANMDGAAVDSILMPNYATQQFIFQKNADHYNGNLIAEGKHTERCSMFSTRRGSAINTVAGVNAGSMTDNAFETNNQLIELVWSPCNGLRLKCTDQNLKKRMSPISWSSNSGNMIISTKENVQIWESGNNGDVAVGDPASTQLTPTTMCEDSTQARLIKSQYDIEGTMPPHQEEHPMKLDGNMDTLTTMNVSAMDINSDDSDHSPDKETVICTQKEKIIVVDNDMERIITTASLNSSSSPVEENRIYATALSAKSEHSKVDLLSVKTLHGDSSKTIDSVPFEINGDIGSEDIHKACLDDTSLPYTGGNSISLDGNRAETTFFIEEMNRNKMEKFSLSKISIVNKHEPTIEIDKKPSKLKVSLCSLNSTKPEAVSGSDRAEMGLAVANSVEGNGEKGSAESIKVNPNDMVSPSKVSPNSVKNQGKRFTSDADMDSFVSGGKINDLNEIIECSKGKEMVSKRKMEWFFDRLLAIESKRTKKYHDETIRSKSFSGQERNFMNCISNNKKCFLERCEENRVHDCPSTYGRNKDPHVINRDFNNTCQTLNCPRTRRQLEDVKNMGPNDQGCFKGSKESVVANCGTFNFFIHEDPEKGTVKFTKVNPISSKKHLDDEYLSTEPTSTPACDTMLTEKPECNGDKNCMSCKTDFMLIKDALHSSESFLHDNFSLSDGKDVSKTDNVDKSALNLSDKKSKDLGDLWFTRFSPKDSENISSTLVFKPDVGNANGNSVKCNNLFPQSSSGSFSIKRKNNIDLSSVPPAKKCANAGSRRVQNHFVSSPVLVGSKDSRLESTKELKSMLCPKENYKEFIRLDKVFCSLAKKCDLSHITPLEVADAASREHILCYFCGINGHSLKECKWIQCSEPIDSRKTLNLYDISEETSCLCIRCFEFGHWAIACPHALSRKRAIYSNLVDGNYDKVTNNVHYQNLLTSHDIKNMPQSDNMDGKDSLAVANAICHGESSRTNTELKVQKNASAKITGDMVLNGLVLDSRPIKKDMKEYNCYGVSGKGILNGYSVMQSILSNFASRSQRNQNKAFYNYIDRQIPEIPVGTFDAIRKLRFSRKDILKWSKSSISNFSIEGYFLRLRLGKWEEELGGTGYCMARVSGASHVKPFVICKIPISVDLGGLKCSIDWRYVSNHDFIEDELMAWWCATLSGHGLLPSSGDLSFKLTQRRRYDF